jgi:hypothetical protein
VLSSKRLEQLIDPAGIIDPDGEAQKLALGKGRELVSPAHSAVLQLLLIDGPAGVGKTSFIERMVYERAVDVTLPPILHITSKGRRLSNLPDATEFARSAIATFPPASRSPMIPEPTTAASNRNVPTPSAASLRAVFTSVLPDPSPAIAAGSTCCRYRRAATPGTGGSAWRSL